MNKTLLYTYSAGTVILLLVIAVGIASLANRAHAGEAPSANVITRGGGKTAIEGGTGPTGGFMPVVTTIAFHVEHTAETVTGDLECLAVARSTATGPSASFPVNVMYVTSKVKTADVKGETGNLKGTALLRVQGQLRRPITRGIFF